MAFVLKYSEIGITFALRKSEHIIYSHNIESYEKVIYDGCSCFGGSERICTDSAGK